MAADGEKPKAKKGPVFYGGILTFIGGVLLLMSFSSPYWLQSYEIAYLDFKNMGLWEFCFFNFRFPNSQHDHKFNGCHHVFSDEYRILREWILPAWLQAVQAFVSLAFLASFSAQIVVSLMLMRWPLVLWRRFQYETTLTTFFFTVSTAVSLFLAVAVFGGRCWDRSWLMYPNYNYLSWSYYMAIFSLGFHALASLLFGMEAYTIRQRNSQQGNILMHMQPAESHHGSAYI
ncbi:uncharacterized protein LOC119103270 isoform X2 [Pollicipes pollicipes]|uniref:uncharacterized protein LOC119103270 isoform X2 n=1 Tax=Pollicipes pollicipes TaxID=41117 RepID=UPI00188591D1|nr:uncharacterized protein LOC119103270 isoform X2 [Pollicipes pollicipes]